MLEYFKQLSVESGMAWGGRCIWISKLAGKKVSYRKETLFRLNRALVVTAKVCGTANYCSSNSFICCERNREATWCGLYTMCRSSASLRKDMFEAWRDMQSVDCAIVTATPAQNNKALEARTC